MKKISPKLAAGLLALLSIGILFALGETPRLIDKLVNYPNPFDSRKEETTISYQIPRDASVRIKIVDLFGYPVKEFNFSQGEMGARSGENNVRWDGTDETGQKVAKGGYICQVILEGDQVATGVRKIGVIH